MGDNNSQDTEGELFSSSSSVYRAQKLLGCGTFGEVLQCINLTSNETVAVKFIRHNRLIKEAKHEEAIYKKLEALNSNKFNIVRRISSFTYEGLYCLEFEKLDINLHEFVQRSPFQSLELKEIRPILQQISTALQFLSSIGIVHSDLKPDNIMMVDHLNQPLKIKIIDFGLAFPVSKARQGATVQARWYRSPEILLGAPFNEAIDIWSLGCIAAQMFMGKVLFPGKDEYDMMRHMVYTVGKPADYLISAGLYSLKYFNERYLGRIQWRFKSSLEARHFVYNPRTIKSLNDLLEHNSIYKLSGEDAKADQCDRESFVDLLTKMLKMDMSERITPSQILQHPFITMGHLEGFSNSPHVKSCSDLMSICDDGEGTSSSTASVIQDNIPESHPEGPEQPRSADISGESSKVKKRKREKEADESVDCSNRTPHTSPTKKRRSRCLDPVPTETKSVETKRKRDDTNSCTTSCDNSPAKKRRSRCLDPVPTETKSVETKRKRDDTNSCTTSCDNSPAKKRQSRCLDPVPTETKSVETKRKRDDTNRCTTSCDNSPAKRICVQTGLKS